MNPLTEQKLKEILEDKISGSRDLLIKLNSFFYENFNQIDDFPALLLELKKRFYTFHTIISYLTEIEEIYLTQGGDTVYDYVRNFFTSETEVYDKIFTNFEKHIKRIKNIITFSNSRTVFEILYRLHKKNKKLSVTVCESRPQNEGRILAEALLDLGITVNFITEAMIPEFTETADIAVVGADTILKNGNVVNKTGTKLLAITCKYYKKPFYVFADKSKLKNSNTFHHKKESPREIWDFSHPKLNIENSYFEIVDKKLITKIIWD